MNREKLIQEPIRYSYSRYPKIASRVITPILAIVSLGCSVFAAEHGLHVGAAVCFTFFIFFLTIAVLGLFISASIVVTKDEIFAFALGKKLKGIQWRNVTKAKKVRYWNAGKSAYEDTFYIFDNTSGIIHRLLPNIYGPISFSGEIIGVGALLCDINKYSQQYQFPLFEEDQEKKWVKGETDAGGQRPSRSFSRIDEVKVQNF